MLVADAGGHGEPLDRVAVLHEQRRDVERRLGLERRRIQGDGLRRIGLAVPVRGHVVEARGFDRAGGVGLIEAELELVPAAERLVDVVLRGGVDLQPRTVANRVRGVVAGDDARGVVGQRLGIAVQIGGEQDRVVAERARRRRGCSSGWCSTAPDRR